MVTGMVEREKVTELVQQGKYFCSKHKLIHLDNINHTG